MNTNDTTDYIQGYIDNIYIILMNYKDYVGFVNVDKTDDSFIPRYPYCTIELANFQEEWKEIPRKKTIIANFDITYYFANLNDKNCRQGLRLGLSKIANVFRENWSLNDYTPQLGSTVTSVTPYVLAKNDNVIAGGVIALQCKKVINVEFSLG